MPRRSHPIIALRQLPAFRRCSVAELTLVAGRAEDHFADAGDVIFGEGSTGGDVFVVLRGKADVRRGGDSVAVVGPGEWFGDVAAVDRTPRAATVVALEPMRLLRVPHDDFTQLVARIPSLRRAVLATVAARAAGSTRGGAIHDGLVRSDG